MHTKKLSAFITSSGFLYSIRVLVGEKMESVISKNKTLLSFPACILYYTAICYTYKALGIQDAVRKEVHVA
jgi:hypothetical protein